MWPHHVCVELVNEALAERQRVLATGSSPVYDLVVYVCSTNSGRHAEQRWLAFSLMALSFMFVPAAGSKRAGQALNENAAAIN